MRDGSVVLGADGRQPQALVLAQQGVGALLQELDGDVDRNVDETLLAREQRLDQDTRLGRAAAAELRERHVLPDSRDDVLRVLAEDALLGARGVVLGQRADGLEQARAEAVVEEATRQLLGTARQPVPDRAQEALALDVARDIHEGQSRERLEAHAGPLRSHNRAPTLQSAQTKVQTKGRGGRREATLCPAGSSSPEPQPGAAAPEPRETRLRARSRRSLGCAAAGRQPDSC